VTVFKERRHDGDDRMRGLFAALGGALALATLSACTPTVKVEVAPINIYAKLDANVRLQLDEDVKALIQKNPNLF
jgi:hypothetical protein